MEHKEEIEKLRSDDGDFHHGFNSGVLAAVRMFMQKSDILHINEHAVSYRRRHPANADYFLSSSFFCPNYLLTNRTLSGIMSGTDGGGKETQQDNSRREKTVSSH
jgi:hypothetical protein